MILELGSNQFKIIQTKSSGETGQIQMQIIEGPNAGINYDFNIPNGQHKSVGRKQAHDIFFDDDQHLSNNHARIFFCQDTFYLEDFQSTNG